MREQQDGDWKYQSGLGSVMFLCFRVAELIFGVGLFVFQPLLVFFCYALICGLTFFFLMGVVWNFDSTILSVLCTGLTLFESSNILWNYTLAVITGPGNPPFPEALEDGQLGGATRVKVCKKCNRIKPARTHHCSLCRKCVMRMDHHCPWVANCVGHCNYPYFYLFLAHSWLACIVATLFTAPRMFGLFGLNTGGMTGVGYNTSVTALCGAVALAAAFLVFWHTFLVTTNQTTLEFYSNRADVSRRHRGDGLRNPYDLGWWKKNVEQAFGRASWGQLVFKAFVPCIIRPEGDGLTWDRADMMMAVRQTETTAR